MQLVVYICGPYGGDVDANIQRAREAAIAVWEAGHVALCPHLNTAHFERDCGCAEEEYLSGDLALLRRCDMVLAIDGWPQSEGACREVDAAETVRIPVIRSLSDLPDARRGDV